MKEHIFSSPNQAKKEEGPLRESFLELSAGKKEELGNPALCQFILPVSEPVPPNQTSGNCGKGCCAVKDMGTGNCLFLRGAGRCQEAWRGTQATVHTWE